jgi:formylmethanofuran dehydrogenase subunit E
MVATGATYGKGNIRKLFYSKMAFTLIEAKSGKGIRVSLKPEFFEKALQSPFVQERKKGVPPQDISPETTNPLVERILNLPEAEFLNISKIFQKEVKKGSPNFEVKRCSKCGEAVFTDKLKKTADGKLLCIPCGEAERS